MKIVPERASVRGLWRGFVDLLIPPLCVACGAGLGHASSRDGPPPDALGEVLCGACRSDLVPIGPDVCALCQAAPPSAWLDSERESPVRCHACAQRASPLDGCLASVEYSGDAERWIRRFKYPPHGLAGFQPAPRAIARALVIDAARCSTTPSPAPDVVVPIPLHPRRLRGRGFNPALLLARGLSREYAAPIAPDLLVRAHDTPSQTRLTRGERRRNVRGAFACETTHSIPGNVWLVDDVVTTGSTLEEAARCLRRGGARTIHAFCAARAPAR